MLARVSISSAQSRHSFLEGNSMAKKQQKFGLDAHLEFFSENDREDRGVIMHTDTRENEKECMCDSCGKDADTCGGTLADCESSLAEEMAEREVDRIKDGE